MKFRYHLSHVIVQGADGPECRNCWGCICHSPDILTKSCPKTVKIETHPQSTVDSVYAQSARYGKQIQQLENAGKTGDLLEIKKAWSRYWRQLQGTSLAEIARAGFYNLYG